MLRAALVGMFAAAVPASGAWANTDGQKLKEGYRCSIGSAYRLFSLHFPETGDACQVLYEKADARQPVRPLWRARRDQQFCIDRMRGSVNKLIDAGWQCEFSTVSLTYAPPPPAQRDDKQTPGLARPVFVDKQAGRSAASARGKAQPTPEYDDWFHRWDEAGRRLVFTLYNKTDGTKARSFSWSHRGFARRADSPSNTVFIQNQKGQPILIVAWPGKDTQFITAINPLRQDAPFCEIETDAQADNAWGFGMDATSLVLTGKRASRIAPGQWEPVRRECPLASD